MTEHEKFLDKKSFVTGIDYEKNYGDEAYQTIVDADRWKDRRDARYELAATLGIQDTSIPHITSSDSNVSPPRAESSASGARRAREEQARRERRREQRDKERRR